VKSVATGRWRSLILAMMMTLGAVVPVAAQRPDPHSGDDASPSATAEATAIPAGCELVEPYTNALYQTIEDSGAFADFYYSFVDFGDLSVDDAQEIIADGDAMIADLEALDVPPPYAKAHEHILVFLQINIDMARFYGIDTSVVPDIAAYESALATITEGETALAQACPDEVEAVGGYIMIDPGELETPVDPESIPE
jgi:hypothetical protein